VQLLRLKKLTWQPLFFALLASTALSLWVVVQQEVVLLLLLLLLVVVGEAALSSWRTKACVLHSRPTSVSSTLCGESVKGCDSDSTTKALKSQDLR
jgi:hypothetical protein